MDDAATPAQTAADASLVALAQQRIGDVFARQRETALRLRRSDAAERIAKIRRLRDALFANRQAIYEAGARDFGKPQAEIDLTEILPVAIEAAHAIRQLKRWMRRRRVTPTLLMLGTQAWVQPEPKGRCLIISPWNYPVNLTFGPLVSAIAAGNAVVLKPSEMTPHLTAVMVRIVGEVFAEDEVAIFEGDAAVSTALLALPFDHIFFTGSPAVGKVVMAAAAKHLSSVTLELGGKSPTIVDETADLAKSAANIVWGKFTNNGQTCIAPDHIYVHERVHAEFVQQLKLALERTYGAVPQASPDLARVVNTRHTQRLAGLLDDALSQGATVLSGGEVSTDQRYVAPTLIGNVPAQARIQQEEIFGPLLPLHRYTQLDEVIAAINAAPKPLALYVYSRDEKNIRRLLRETSSGGACVNHSVVHFAHGNLPFGGVNNSGIGASHGEAGFKAFSHERAVVRRRWQLASLFYPPYTKWTRWIAELVIRTV